MMIIKMDFHLFYCQFLFHALEYFTFSCYNKNRIEEEGFSMFQIGNKVLDPSEKKAVDQLRSLGLDMIDRAQSGHPGIVLGAAPILYTLYAKHMVVNPKNPVWINRDRFVMSAGHGSALLYATLFLAGYDLSIDDLKSFRTIDSITPGHPEYGVTPGVDMTTGPLGQGFASAVGMAIAEAYLRSYFKKKLIDHYTYVLCGDGDLMEGISYEAASLAGTLGLNKLIVLYDSNQVCLDSKTEVTFNDNIKDRFSALGWNYLLVSDGEDLLALDKAIEDAKKEENKPTLIEVKTVIGKYSKYEATSKVHGAPLDPEDLAQVKEKLEVHDIPFTVSKEAVTVFQEHMRERCENAYKAWNTKLERLDDDEKIIITALEKGKYPLDFKGVTYEAPADLMESTRDASSKVLNAFASINPFFLGGSADLSSSNRTYLKEEGDFSKNNPLGKNIFYGVREHAMAAISNGIALSNLRPFASTFLVFSDYLKPSLRLSALMNLPVTYIFTHDSIMVGEDGPTHQPVEQLIALRSIPNLEVFRPADANEVLGTYKYLSSKKEGPIAIILGRNKVPIEEATKVNEVKRGAYIVRHEEKQLQGILIATGEELALALDAAQSLYEQGIDLRVISMPSIERFKKEDKTYQEELLPLTVKTFVIEASSSYSWYPFVYNEKYIIGVDTFGASGKKEDLALKYHLDLKSIIEKIKETL